MNRLTEYFEEPAEEPSSYGDFFVISGAFGTACVTRETAEYVERQLDVRPPPAWIVFSDRVGSRVRVRTSQIRCVCESTAEQRAGDRKLDRARRLEEKSDRLPWEDE
jgi:hypothetical protein